MSIPSFPARRALLASAAVVGLAVAAAVAVVTTAPAFAATTTVYVSPSGTGTRLLQPPAVLAVRRAGRGALDGRRDVR